MALVHRAKLTHYFSPSSQHLGSFYRSLTALYGEQRHCDLKLVAGGPKLDPEDEEENSDKDKEAAGGDKESSAVVFGTHQVGFFVNTYMYMCVCLVVTHDSFKLKLVIGVLVARLLSSFSSIFSICAASDCLLSYISDCNSGLSLCGRLEEEEGRQKRRRKYANLYSSSQKTWGKRSRMLYTSIVVLLSRYSYSGEVLIFVACFLKKVLGRGPKLSMNERRN